MVRGYGTEFKLLTVEQMKAKGWDTDGCPLFCWKYQTHRIGELDPTGTRIYDPTKDNLRFTGVCYYCGWNRYEFVVECCRSFMPSIEWKLLTDVNSANNYSRVTWLNGTDLDFWTAVPQYHKPNLVVFCGGLTNLREANRTPCWRYDRRKSRRIQWDKSDHSKKLQKKRQREMDRARGQTKNKHLSHLVKKQCSNKISTNYFRSKKKRRWVRKNIQGGVRQKIKTGKMDAMDFHPDKAKGKSARWCRPRDPYLY